ncbi:MAG: DUF5615 family PIN-like protein [Terracidiphilus sp.]
MKVKFLIDECLHASLVKLAHRANYAADRVNFLNLRGYEDWELMKLIVERDYTFVTNNRLDFLELYGRAPLHAGLVILVPNVAPNLQGELFVAALQSIGDQALINTVVEVDYRDNGIGLMRYVHPREPSSN